MPLQFTFAFSNTYLRFVTYICFFKHKFAFVCNALTGDGAPRHDNSTTGETAAEAVKHWADDATNTTEPAAAASAAADAAAPQQKQSKDAAAPQQKQSKKKKVIVKPVESPVVDDPSTILARAVVEHPREYLTLFLQYWGHPSRLPDLSEGRTIPVEKLQFWQNQKITKDLKAHKSLPGLCAKWSHIALDFCMAQNHIPVIFTKPGSNEMFDMTVPFVHCFWVCYSAQMNGSPALTSKASQKV